MPVTEFAVRDSLRAVAEPCSLLMGAPTNIVDMGLVDRVIVDHGRVEVQLVLTDPSCIHFAALQRYVSDVLLERQDIEQVEVTASTTTLWMPDRSTPTQQHVTAAPWEEARA